MTAGGVGSNNKTQETGFVSQQVPVNEESGASSSTTTSTKMLGKDTLKSLSLGVAESSTSGNVYPNRAGSPALDKPDPQNQDFQGFDAIPENVIDRVMTSPLPIKADFSSIIGIDPDTIDFPQSPERVQVLTTFKYNEAFLSALQEKLDGGEITQKQFSQIESQLYHPEYVYPNNSELEQIASDIRGQVLPAFIESEGLESGWQPKTNALLFDARADRAFGRAFDRGVESYQPPLTAEQKEQVKVALVNPKAVSPEILKISQQIEKDSIAQVQKEMSLPSTWKPIQKTANAEAINNPNVALVQTGVDALEEQLEVLETAMNLLPANDPGRISTLDYMKAVSVALQTLSDMLALIQYSDTKLNKTQSATLLEAVNNKLDAMKESIEENKKLAEENKKAESKNSILGSVFKVIEVIVAVALVVAAFAAVLAPGVGAFAASVLMAAALFVLAASLSNAFGGPDLMKEAFGAISKGVNALMPANAPEWMKTAVDVLAKAVIIAAIVVLTALTGGILAVSLGAKIVMDAVLKSGIIEDTIRAFGGDDQAVMIATLVVMSILVVGVVCCSIGAIRNAAKAAVAMGSEAATKMERMAEMLSKGANYTRLAATMAESTATISVEINKMTIYNAMKKIVENKGDLDSYVIEMDNLIKMLKGIISMLMDELPSMGEGIASIQRLLVKMKRDFATQPQAALFAA
jgi:uncharacterized membrane protein